MPCKKAAPTGRTPRKTKEEREVSKPNAAKHFTQREKKHAMAQVKSIKFSRNLGDENRVFLFFHKNIFVYSH